jgi:hypothetical protein
VKKRDEPLPDWLDEYDQYDAWDVCSCWITSASPTSTFTYTPVSASWITDPVSPLVSVWELNLVIQLGAD